MTKEQDQVWFVTFVVFKLFGAALLLAWWYL